MRIGSSRVVWVAWAILLGMARVGEARGPVAVVVLPPQGSVKLDAGQRAAAEALCDEIAAKLSGDGALRVVDRTQIDKVLAERTVTGTTAPVLAYDAMLRVRVDPLGTPAKVKVEVIDLSAGNVVGVSEWEWDRERPTAGAEAITKACRESVLKAPGVDGRMKVRLLGVATPKGMGRLEPLQQQLSRMFEQTMERSVTARGVQHLEALTAKEESLLLLLGHARLGGGREFSPQADMVLETEMSEEGGKGKTFEDTPIEIRFRLSRNGAAGDWTRAKGRAGDWGKLAPEACASLAKALGETKPQQAAADAVDMITRRAQAEAEFKAAMELRTAEGKPDAQRLAAAIKLDPTYEPAAYWIVESLTFQRGAGPRMDAVREALGYLERFKGDAEHRKRVVELAFYRAPAKPNAVETQVLRAIVEIGLTSGIQAYHEYCGLLVQRVHTGMLEAKVDLASRLAWLDGVRARMAALEKQTKKLDHFYRDNVESSFLEFRAFLVRVAADAGDRELVVTRMHEFMALRPWATRDAWGVAKKLREALAKFGDAEILREYDPWLKVTVTEVRQYELEWRDYEVYGKTDKAPEAKRLGAMLPVVLTAKGIYGVRGAESRRQILGWSDRIPSRQKLVFARLDEKGAPAGEAVLVDWPAIEGDISVSGAAHVNGSLFLATKRTGLLVYDEAKQSWRQIGTAQGLPAVNVFFVSALDEKTLLLVAGDPHQYGAYCTMDIASGKITLLHRLDSTHNGWSAMFGSPIDVWRDGERLMALNYVGLAEDILQKTPKYREWPTNWPQNWKKKSETGPPEPTGMAVVGGKRYVMAMTGLHEIEPSGKVVRSWWNRMNFDAGSPEHGNLSRDWISPPGDFPTIGPRETYRFVAQATDHLFLAGDGALLLCYEPASDTWYGPFSFYRVGSDSYPIGTRSGVWLGGTDGSVFVKTDEFIAAAKDAGRVMTSAEIRQTKRKLAEEAGAMELAKFHLMMRDFAAARKQVEAILEGKPQDPDALLLMAVVHDFWCLNKPDEALAWYDKLAAIESDPRAIYTGLYARFRMEYNLKRWEQAIATGEQLLDKVPCLYAGMTREIDRFSDYARARRDKEAGAATRPSRP